MDVSPQADMPYHTTQAEASLLRLSNLQRLGLVTCLTTYSTNCAIAAGAEDPLYEKSRLYVSSICGCSNVQLLSLCCRTAIAPPRQWSSPTPIPSCPY